MSFFSLTRLLGLANSTPRRAPAKPKSRLQVEQLERRDLMAAGPVISGYVYVDGNNNGLRDAGEQAIPGTTLELTDSRGIVVDTAVSDGNGYYQFEQDNTAGTAARQVSQTIQFTNSRTTWSQTASVQKFDPSLGTLTAVEVINSGSFRSWVRVESTDNAAQTVKAEVNGTLRLSGPGLSSFDAAGSTTQTFSAAAYDGQADYAGGSGADMGWRQVDVSRSTMLTSPSDLSQFTGTDAVSFTEMANGGGLFTSSSGGNLVSQITSEAEANVTVIYHYIPNGNLQPGTYVITEHQPAGYADGQETQGNVTPLPNSVGTDRIVVTLNRTDVPNNNFGERQQVTVTDSSSASRSRRPKRKMFSKKYLINHLEPRHRKNRHRNDL